MSYELPSGKYHRMPVTYGPTHGPRQVPGGISLNDGDSHLRRTITAAFRVSPAALTPLLPPRFRLRGEPTLVVELQYMKEIEWLAGRGYNIAGVKIPVTFDGVEGAIDGLFYSVLWESLTDPILSGRDELGAPKLYAEINEPRVFQGREHHAASWLGFGFLDIELSGARDELPTDEPFLSPGSGSLQWKYVPKTGAPDVADVSCITLTPAANPAAKVLRRQRANAAVKFHHARWEDLPTMFQIVNTLADIPLTHCVGCAVTELRGMKDLGDTRVVS